MTQKLPWIKHVESRSKSACSVLVLSAQLAAAQDDSDGDRRGDGDAVPARQQGALPASIWYCSTEAL
jgi:hypothetical protein